MSRCSGKSLRVRILSFKLKNIISLSATTGSFSVVLALKAAPLRPVFAQLVTDWQMLAFPFSVLMVLGLISSCPSY